MSQIATISVQELADLHNAGPVDLIDVRTPAEFGAVHATMATNVPLDSLDAAAVISDRAQSDRPLYIICLSGGRSANACQQFIDAGYQNVVSVDGGTKAWDAAGLPVNRGRKVISLERQVRIVAGSLALVGAVLAMTVHPYFAGLPAFIGAGLTFAGITDTCGMGMLLARMPWNR